jgi:hypothetical protein
MCVHVGVRVGADGCGCGSVSVLVVLLSVCGCEGVDKDVLKMIKIPQGSYARKD